MDRKEVFARFCDYFTHWVDKTAGGWGSDFNSPYQDNFNVQDCYDFVKLIQQKNALTATVLKGDVKGELIQEENSQPVDQRQQSLEDLNNEARKELRSVSDRSRRVNLRADIDQAINDILQYGDVTQSTYEALRENVIESTLAKVPNDMYDVAQDIRRIMGGNFLSKERWDATRAVCKNTSPT